MIFPRLLCSKFHAKRGNHCLRYIQRK